MAGYAGNVKLKGYLGDTKIKGYLGNVKVFGGELWEEALELVGYSAGSLSEALSNSSAMTAVAGNADATAIMKDNYSAEMTTAIDSVWNEGLNLLNFTCGLDFYLYYPGNQCVDVSGGWEYKTSGSIHGTPTYDLANENYMHISATSGGNYSGYGYSPLTFYLYNKTARYYHKLGYNKIVANCKVLQGTNSYNIPGTFSAGMTQNGASSLYPNDSDCTSITIATSNMTSVIHEGDLTWYTGLSSNTVISFRNTPKYQNGAFGNTHDLYVYSVKVISTPDPNAPDYEALIEGVANELDADGTYGSHTATSPMFYFGQKNRTIYVHVASITGGTLIVGTKRDTSDSGTLVEGIRITAPGLYAFTYRFVSGTDSYSRVCCKMLNGNYARAPVGSMTVSSNDGTAVIDAVYCV